MGGVERPNLAVEGGFYFVLGVESLQRVIIDSVQRVKEVLVQLNLSTRYKILLPITNLLPNPSLLINLLQDIPQHLRAENLQDQTGRAHLGRIRTQKLKPKLLLRMIEPVIERIVSVPHVK